MIIYQQHVTTLTQWISSETQTEHLHLPTLIVLVFQLYTLHKQLIVDAARTVCGQETHSRGNRMQKQAVRMHI